MGLDIHLLTKRESDRTLFTPDLGEPLFVPLESKLYIGDGVTPGGLLVSGSGGGGFLTSIYKNSNYNVENGDLVHCDTTAGSFVITAPSDPEFGDKFAILDITSSFAINNVTVNGNGEKIQGSYDDFIADISGLFTLFVYQDTEYGWRIDIGGVEQFFGESGYSGTSGFSGYSGVNGHAYNSISVSNDYQAFADDLVHCDTSGGQIVITAPASPVFGEKFAILDVISYASVNNIIVNGNGEKIQGSYDEFIVDIDGMISQFFYQDTEYGWRLDIGGVDQFYAESGYSGYSGENGSTWYYGPLTQVEIDALTPEEGVIVYNLDTKEPEYYDGTSWNGMARIN